MAAPGLARQAPASDDVYRRCVRKIHGSVRQRIDAAMPQCKPTASKADANRFSRVHTKPPSRAGTGNLREGGATMPARLAGL